MRDYAVIRFTYSGSKHDVETKLQSGFSRPVDMTSFNTLMSQQSGISSCPVKFRGEGSGSRIGVSGSRIPPLISQLMMPSKVAEIILAENKQKPH